MPTYSAHSWVSVQNQEEMNMPDLLKNFESLIVQSAKEIVEVEVKK